MTITAGGRRFWLAH